MKPIALALLTFGVTSACLAAQSGSAPPAENLQWKDLTSKGFPLRFYGFFRFDVHYNTARMDSVVTPTRVLPETKRNDDQISLDPRLTRFGFDVTPAKVNDTTIKGKLEIDFANFPAGVAESRATPRIRLAYIDISEGQLALRVGQDWDVVSPLYPSVNYETLMWNAGNLGDRRPQIQGSWKSEDDKSELKACLGLTGAINNEDLDTPTGERDGFDSGLPHLQVRARTRPFELVEKKPVEIGVWGLYGKTETDTPFNGETHFATWVGGIDLQVPICSSMTLRGEAWTGENLGDVRGGMGQTINTATGEEIAASGGWAEIVYSHTAKTRFHVGGTIDDPDNEDLSTTLASANRRRNLSGYLGTVVDWESGLRTGLDFTYWQTEYTGPDGTNGSSGNAVRMDLWFMFNF